MRVSEHVAPQLSALLSDLRTVLPRLTSAQVDDEAIHDLRVGLRRLRSLLRPLKPVYGSAAVGEVRAALKAIADASSTLRDEEVLEQLLRDLELPAATRAALEKWLARRVVRTRRARATFVKGLADGRLAAALDTVASLLSAPPKTRRDKEIVPFARKVVLSAQRDVELSPVTGLDDTEGLHDLRIEYKHLRYAIDGLEAALAPELVAMRDVAAKLQKRLGDLHDLDVAKTTLQAARGLAPTHRNIVLAALEARREKAVRKFREDGGTRATTLGPGLAKGLSAAQAAVQRPA